MSAQATPKGSKRRGRPPLGDDRRRIHLPARVLPATRAAVDDLASQLQTTRGRVIDMLVEANRCPVRSTSCLHRRQVVNGAIEGAGDPAQ